MNVKTQNCQSKALKDESIFNNVGCHSRPLDIAGVQDLEVLNSISVMELDHVPEHLIFITGGGRVGLEFAQMFRRFASRVTIIQHRKHLLGGEDP